MENKDVATTKAEESTVATSHETSDASDSDSEPPQDIAASLLAMGLLHQANESQNPEDHVSFSHPVSSISVRKENDEYIVSYARRREAGGAEIERVEEERASKIAALEQFTMARSKLFAEDEVVFQQATEQQAKQVIEKRAQLASGPLSAREFCYMHHMLSQTKLMEGNSAHWILTLKTQPGVIVASCSTLMRDALLTTSKGAKSVKAVVISDILVEAQYRRRGLARMLLQKLTKVLDGYGAETALGDKIEFSILYSGPHTELYEEVGWMPYGARQLRILLNGKDEKTRQVVYPSTEVVQRLEWADAHGVAKSDRNMSMLRMSAARKDTKVHVQLTPTIDTFKYLLLRDALLVQQLEPNRPLTEASKGGIYIGRSMGGEESLQTTDGGIDVFGCAVKVLWVRDLINKRLIVVRTVLSRVKGLEEGIQAVLQLAVAEAGAWGLREVVVWEPDEMVVGGARMLEEERGVRVVVDERRDDVPCLRMRGGEKRDVMWEGREYYAFC